ncbi:MAG: rod shape-determining protein MreD [Bacteroidales bacterium]|nr:rod shape-determining protein MreD [Bacteroidales bacterium]
MNVYLENSIRFFLVVVIQIFILNNIYLHGFVVPILYIYFVIKLPFKTLKMGVLLCSFLIGIFIDLLTGTPGINAAATTAVAFLRPFYIKMVLPKLNKESTMRPSVQDMGVVIFVAYASLLIFTHSLLLIMLEVFGFQNFGNTLLHAFLMTLVALLMVICCEFVFRQWSHQ